VIADITRPLPSERLVPWILAELSHVPRENFVIINAPARTAPTRTMKLVQMLGADIVDSVRIVNHSAFDDVTLTHMGRTSFGGEIWMDNAYLDRRCAHCHRLC